MAQHERSGDMEADGGAGALGADITGRGQVHQRHVTSEKAEPEKYEFYTIELPGDETLPIDRLFAAKDINEFLSHVSSEYIGNNIFQAITLSQEHNTMFYIEVIPCFLL